MAEATGLRNSALPYPVYGVPFGIVISILDADGDPVTGATGLDSEVSKNGDTFADCTNEATEIATSSGMYYLLLTAAEMTADVVAVIVKTSSSGAKTTPITLYPRKLVTLRTGTAQGGAAGYITLDASAGSRDDRWNGCLCVAVIDSNTEARIITDYTGSNQQAAVTPDWNVTPDSDDTFTIYLPEGMQAPTVNVSHVNETAQTAGDIYGKISPTTFPSGTLPITTTVMKADLETIKTQTVTCAAGVTILASVGTASTSTAQTGDAYAIVSDATNGNAAIRTVVDTIQASTDNLPSDPADASDIADAFVTLTSGITSAFTALESHGDSEWATADVSGIPAAVWGETLPGAYSSGTAGYNLDAQVSAAGGGGGITAADVWAYATRELTSGANLNDLSESDIRDAVGLATANLDSQLGDLPTNSELATGLGDLQTHGDSTWATATGFAVPGDAMTLAADAVNSTSLAASAVTAIQSGLATTGDVTTVGSAVTAVQGDVTAILDDTGTSGVVLAPSYNLYTAGIEFNKDAANSRDEYTVFFRKNGVRQTSVTSPTIRVVKRSDGSNLIASTALTSVGSDGIHTHNATGASRTTMGESYLVIVQATIDGSTRTFEKFIGRDDL